MNETLHVSHRCKKEIITLRNTNSHSISIKHQRIVALLSILFSALNLSIDVMKTTGRRAESWNFNTHFVTLKCTKQQLFVVFVFPIIFGS